MFGRLLRILEIVVASSKGMYHKEKPRKMFYCPAFRVETTLNRDKPTMMTMLGLRHTVKLLTTKVSPVREPVHANHLCSIREESTS